MTDRQKDLDLEETLSEDPEKDPLTASTALLKEWTASTAAPKGVDTIEILEEGEIFMKPKRFGNYTLPQVVNLLKFITFWSSSKYPENIVQLATDSTSNLVKFQELYTELKKDGKWPDESKLTMEELDKSIEDVDIYDNPPFIYFGEAMGDLEMIDHYREKTLTEGGWHKNYYLRVIPYPPEQHHPQENLLKLGLAVEKFLGLEKYSGLSIDQLIDRIQFHPASKEIESRLNAKLE